MDCENQEKDKDGNPTTTGAFNNSNTNNSECSSCCDRAGQAVFFVFPANLRLSCRYSDHRLHTGAVPAHRSLGVPASHVLLLRLGTGGLHHLHRR